MPLLSHTRQIIELAWSRILGLPDGAITEAAASGGQRLLAFTDDPDAGTPPARPPHHRATQTDEQVATFVRLFGTSVLYGPAWLLEAAADVDEEVLALETTLIRLGAGHGARSLGEGVLYYAEEPPTIQPSETVAVSYEAADAAALEGLCPADDVAAVGLSTLDSTFTLVPDGGTGTAAGDPLAGAGYEEWQGLIGHLGALVRPDVRRRGLGTYAAAVAMEEAFTEGLVPQWRGTMGSTGSQRIADALGFELSGSQTTVLFGA